MGKKVHVNLFTVNLFLLDDWQLLMGKFGVAILGTSCPTNLPEVTSWRGIQGQPIAQKCILGQIISIQRFTMKLDGLMVIASDHK